MEKKSLDKATVKAAFDAAASAPVVMHPVFGGCARIYVGLSCTIDRKTINMVAAECKARGMIFQRKAHYGMSNAIYIGYDNATGREYCKGESFAAALTAAGLPAYVEGFGD